MIQFQLPQAWAVYRRLMNRQVESREAIEASMATLRKPWATVKSAMARIPEEG